jgi:Flp pilus assembly protein TadG
MRKFARDTSGVTAIEFALVAPVFLMLLFGIIVFGAYLTVTHGVQQIAAEAARSSVAGLSDTERSTLAEATIRNQAGSYPLIQPSRLRVDRIATDPETLTFTVRVSYDASDMFVFLLPSFVPQPPTEISRSAAIQRGGY